jgi:hypothetical protein
MSPQQIVAVALRLFAIWLGIQALDYLPSFFYGGEGQHSRAYVYVTFLLALNVVIIIGLWFFPRSIAGKFVPPEKPTAQPSANADSWLAIGCALIGLWTLTTSIPRLIYLLYILKSTGDQWLADSGLWYQIARSAIGVWLVLGGKGVARVFRWAQYAGIRKEPR